MHAEERLCEDTVRKQLFARREASREAILDNTLFRLPASRTVRTPSGVYVSPPVGGVC